jgi:predicted Zn-dependent peptidase
MPPPSPLVARHELPNGVTAVAIAMPSVHRVVLDAHVLVGSRYEHTEENGISHFLEHMLYRGTPRHPSAHALALAFEELGGTLAAATSVDHGALSLALPIESFAQALPLFAEVFAEPILEGIELERGIVREEILEGLDEDGRPVDADNLVRQVSFADHPLGFPIIGTAETLGRFDRAALETHHRAHYVGQATVVVVAGPFDPETTLAQVCPYFSRLASGSAPQPRPPEPQQHARFRYVRHASSQTQLRVAFRAPAQRDPDEPAVEMLLRVLDDGMSTRLYHRICDARGLCYDVSAAYEPYVDSGLLDLAAETAHERAELVLAELFDIIRELRDDGPSQAELDKARARCGWQLTELLDEPGELAELYAHGALFNWRGSPAERFAALTAVDKERVRRAAERTLRPDALSVVAVGILARRAQDALARRVDRFS